MEWLRYLSILWTVAHALVLFVVLYDLRISKKAVAISFPGMLAVFAVAIYLCGHLSTDIQPTVDFIALFVPCLTYCFLVAKERDARFVYTFCFCYTTCFELISLSSVITSLVAPGNVLLLVMLRLVLILIGDYFALRYYRKFFLELQRSVKKGWGLFALVSVLFFFLLAVELAYPQHIMHRTEDMPAALLIFLLIPITHWAIWKMLSVQKKLYESDEQTVNADKQTAILRNELAMEREFVNQARQNRHDMRHVISIAQDYLAKGNYEGAQRYLSEFDIAVTGGSIQLYCENEVINALLRITARRCERDGVQYTFCAGFPQQLPFSDTETGILFGNLFENAWEAARKCRKPELHIEAQVRNEHLILEIRNSVAGQVQFLDALPVTTKDGGGIGVKSARQILEKHGGTLRMRQEEDTFYTQLMQRL